MACLVSSHLSLPLATPETLAKDLKLRQSALAKFPSQPPSRTAIAHFPSSLTRVNSNWQCQHHLTTAWEQIREPVWSYVKYGICTVISGYWVGPDFEDGWGFVEAFVNQLI